MKIAIIGSGIAGMSAAYFLNKKYEIKVYEKANYIGGHSNTRTVDYGNVKLPVDTGFIVYNEVNYPNLVQLFKKLNVETEKSNMSFSVSIDEGRLEYAGISLSTVFAQKSNLLNVNFLRMLKDILKFNAKAKEVIDTYEEEISLGDFLKRLRVSEYFKKYYLLPMGGAIWSCSVEKMLEYPARTFIAFFNNHNLLSASNQHQWRTVKGGSVEYVKKITESYSDKIKLNSKVQTIIRESGKVIVEEENGNREVFDHVVIATHADQAYWMLNNPAEMEKKILGSFHYQKNTVILHKDKSFMPKLKKTWASWNYLGDSNPYNEKNMTLTYWMNKLQNIDEKYPVFVTMNPTKPINEDLIVEELTYEHPLFNLEAIKAQENIDSIQGKGNVWYVGSYHKYGFHEDALTSSIKVCNKLGCFADWQS